MNKKKYVLFVLPLIIFSGFLFCTILGMLLNPESFYKFFSPTQLYRVIPPQLPHRSYYWDVEHYAALAINPRCNAFYPLWPFIIRSLFHPQSIEQAAHYFLVVANFLSFIGIFALFWVFNIAFKRVSLAFLLVLAYSVNPMAIFRVIGYTESLFALLSTLFIWVCLPRLKINQNIKLCLIFMLTFLLALTRPVLIQICFSSLATLGTILYIKYLQEKQSLGGSIFTIISQHLYEIKLTINIWISALLGYSVYGSFCLIKRGDFLAPFQDQKLWGKSLGLHLELLFTPKSLLFDLLALYLPFIVLFLAIICVYLEFSQKSIPLFIPQSRLWNILLIYPPLLVILYIFNLLKYHKVRHNEYFKKLMNNNYISLLNENYIFWFSIYFTVIHCVIVFFTQDRLFSLGRFIFALPFFFIAVGYIYRYLLPKNKGYDTIYLFIVVSAIALIEQWYNYGQDKWLG
ncbi:mannosyltransferase [Aliinostoc sp. HNIBRCY26]|uniref:mannosyltransferase n=1 Tax=Aliinostoc sp. HNIBRCY26 TaxID=3418997 RepID=UPI003D056311